MRDAASFAPVREGAFLYDGLVGDVGRGVLDVRSIPTGERCGGGGAGI